MLTSLQEKPCLKAPFPWFGGKSRIASVVWERFGNVPNYVEPFFGSGAVLLARPHSPGIETVNDKDCMVANFWRALQAEPKAVAAYADWPVNEADLHARHLWLCSRVKFRERMKKNPDYYDPKMAGWWVWGISQWIGSGWCSRQLPHLGDAGKGVNRQRPHLSNAGTGVHRISLRGNELYAYMHELAKRLRRVRVCCGDWSRVCGPMPTFKQGVTGVFLDPPYSAKANRMSGLYSVDSSTVAKAVRKWALAHDDNPLLRIALCGYEGEYRMPDTWVCIEWKGAGLGSQSAGRGRENQGKERIWFSPHCRRQLTLV